MNTKSSQAVVMVHGLFTNLSVFYFNIAHELSKYFHVVLYDLKSHGMSEPVDEGYDLTTLSKELMILIDTLNLSKVHLVGYSYGGLITLKACMLYPDRVDKVAIIESPKPNRQRSVNMLETYKDNLLNQDLKAYTKSTNLKPGNRTIQKVRKLYDYLIDCTTIQEDMNVDSNLLELLTNEPIKNETLLLYGKLTDCMDAADHLKTILPNSKLLLGEGDHNIPVQNPSWLSKELINFLS